MGLPTVLNDSKNTHLPSPELSILHGQSTPIQPHVITHYLDSHATADPTMLAVQDIHGNQLTYGELQAKSDTLSRILHTLGARRGSRVVLVLERSIPHVIAVFATLRLGAAYVPLDGALVPDTSLEDVVSDAQPALVLVSRTYKARIDLRKDQERWHCIEDLLECPTPDLLLDDPAPQDPAYIIYTSGTTGKSKGVIVSHANVINLACQAPGNLGIARGTKVSQILNVAFDMCAWEIFSCLLNGGSLYLRGPRRAHWIQVMKTAEVLISTPSILEQHDPADFPNVRVVATAGEPCSQMLADRWGRHAQFFNCCGPTEVTIVNTMHRHVAGSANITIGTPTPNNSVYVLHPDMQTPVPRGQVGVMWGGGAGVSLGYLNLPQLTSDRFKPDPFRGTGLMYNTGDLGRVREDGSIDHLGRVDDQVKVKGFRVELDGVSTAMCNCPGVLAACALLIDSELWGFYSPSGIPASRVQEVTALTQPCYAVPSRLLALESLPLTSNGKVDKGTLRRFALESEATSS